MLVVYDWHGGYGHPDHIKVHRVGCRAEELVLESLLGLRVFEATTNRDAMRRLMVSARDAGLAFGLDDDDRGGFDPDGPMDDGNPMGMPEADLTLEVDVSAVVGAKRAAIASHRSQVSDSSFLVELSDDAFARSFDREYFMEHGVTPGMRLGWPFA